MLSHDQTEKLLSNVSKRFSEEKPDFNLDKRDLARMAFASRLVVGSSALDVGTGHGVLLHILADSGKFHNIYGFDIKTHSQAILRNDVSYFTGSIADPSLSLPSADSVVCMEVVEHLEEVFNETMLNNLRKLASHRLVLTVPFEEPEPLWWHDKPGGHRQRFTLDKLETLFPNAYGCLFPRYGVDWIFVIEDKYITADDFTILDSKKFLELYTDF